MSADMAFEKFIQLKPKSVLNIGDKIDSPENITMKRMGIEVLTIDRIGPADIIGRYQDVEVGLQDAIWCSHVLEHQRNPGLFLDKIFHDLKDDGLLAITVPPAKEELAGGHCTIWNKTILVYQLILAGFDCREADIWEYGYNISCILTKKKAELPELNFNKTDLKIIGGYMPRSIL